MHPYSCCGLTAPGLGVGGRSCWAAWRSPCAQLSRRRPLLSLATVLVLSLAVPLHFFTPAFSLALVAFGYLTGRRMEHARPALAVFAGMAALGAVAAPLLGGSVWLRRWLTLLLMLTSGPSQAWPRAAPAWWALTSGCDSGAEPSLMAHQVN